jgi:hypothetical protein
MGLGGFFMHSRVGLDTPYLSPEWFDCVKACIDEAEKLKMQAWLYDEDRWPSGAAGGLVTRHRAYRAHKLIMQECAGKVSLSSNTLALFKATLTGRRATNVERLSVRQKLPALKTGEVYLHFFVKEHLTSDWFNGHTYLDTLSHAAVRAFIQTTHEAYRRNIGRHFGKRVPGIFTDEPNYNHVCMRHQLGTENPWTAQLPRVFKKRYGYDLIAHLPAVFLDTDSPAGLQPRYHYMDCITHLFVDAFGRQIGQWCNKNNMQHTGHLLFEDTLSNHASVVGNCMRFYEHMQAPGMDLLTEHWRVYETAKQVSSAARQFGRKWRLTETYGCTGWDFPFAGHKALGDWQAALGINLRAQHLSWYTMEGEAKRDYPAGIFYQSPWWEQYAKVEDYFGRINAVMTNGTEVRDLLVVHPVESMWLKMKKEWNRDPKVYAYNRMFIALSDSLLTSQIDFDYGDEEIMARHARVTGKETPRFMVGQAHYKAILVPPLLTMRATTLELLKKFRAAGGAVFFAGALPAAMDAVPSPEVKKFARTCRRVPARGAALAKAVAPLARRITVRTRDGRPVPSILYLLREDTQNFYLFLCNTGHDPRELKPAIEDRTMVVDRSAAYDDVRIEGFPGCNGTPLELDPQTGAIHMAAASRAKTGWRVQTSFPALASRLFVVPKAKGPCPYTVQPRLRTMRSIKLGPRAWDTVLSEENVLALDLPRYKIGAKAWQPVREILQIDRAVRDALGIRHRGGQMKQPWAREKKINQRAVNVELEYTFQVKGLPQGALFLALEQPRTFEVLVNNTRLDTDTECGWWCDRSLRKLRLDANCLRIGENKVRLVCRYTEDHPGLEITYLLGTFGVKLDGALATLITPPADLKLGDWVKQGLPFYSGNVGYNRTVRLSSIGSRKVFVRVPAYRGVGVRVLVDGKPAGVIGWEPNEVDITALVPKTGVFNLSIEVLGHRRNSHGPLHLPQKWPTWTGPGQFMVEDKKWRSKYQLVPCGLMQAPMVELRTEF